MVKNLPAIQDTAVRFLGWEDRLEKGKATHSSILAWRIPWTVYSMGSQRVGHDFHLMGKIDAYLLDFIDFIFSDVNVYVY